MTTRLIQVLEQAPDAIVRVPGSKSHTNRALVCAALADGVSVLDGVLFADDTEAMMQLLVDMGLELAIDRDARRVAVTIDIDMSDISDTAQSLAVVAPFADGPVRVTGIDFIRRKETDRIAAVVNEMQRLGIEATEDDDGFTIHPGAPSPGVVDTYDDHRMAMSFAILGLVVPGITIDNPSCVNKTFPDFFDVLEGLS